MIQELIAAGGGWVMCGYFLQHRLLAGVAAAADRENSQTIYPRCIRV
jgi:hypothetical protein